MVEIAVERLKPTKTKIHIEIPKEEIERKQSEIVNRLKKSVKIKGFRKGKTPKEVILRNYKKEIEEDLKRDLMVSAYQFAVSENELHTVSEPVFTDVTYEENKFLSFDATVDVKPEFELKEYKGILITKKPVKVTDEEINTALEEIREAFSTLKEKEGEAQEGDVVVFDLETMDEKTSEPIKELMSDDIQAELGKKQVINEIEQHILNMKAGETKEFTAEFDEKYPLRVLKGKKVKFKLTLKSVKEKKLPELNNEFAQRIHNNFKTVEDLKEDIKERLTKKKETEEISRQKDELLDKLLSEYNFELPDSLVDKEANQMIMEYVREMYYMGVDISSDEFKPKTLREKFEEEAKKRVKTTILFLEIADKEGIDVSNSEIKQAIAEEASRRGTSFEELHKYYEERNLLSVIKMEILGEKVLDFLHKHANISEEGQETPKDKEEHELSTSSD